MFYYRIGEIETFDKWNPPTLKTFKKWLHQWKILHPTTGPYDLYLIGCAAEKWYGNCELDTWDIDIAIKGSIHDYEKLSSMMKDAVRLGFENRIFIDIFWVSWTYEGLDVPVKDYEQIRFYKNTHLESTSGKVTVHDLDYDNNTIELPYGLYKFYRTNNTTSLNKVKDRVEKGIYKHIHVNIKDID